MIKRLLPALGVVLLMVKIAAMAQPKPVIESYLSGFTRPLKVTHAYDSRLFVAEVGGKIKVVKNGVPIHNPAFLDISSKMNNIEWAGIYSVAFHPNYQVNGYFYVLYIVKDKFEAQVSRFQRIGNADSDIASSAETKILTIPFTDVDAGHRGGDMAFGKDNFLYITTGDNGPGSRGVLGDPELNAQNAERLFGKVIRIDVDSPFPAENIQQKIWAKGLRNPWRFSFDRSTGDFWVGDNGQDGWEEINLLKAADVTSPKNFGWDYMEGNAVYRNCSCDIATSFTAPRLAYPGFTNNGGNSASAIGGYVYRGAKYNSFKGCYFFADYISTKIGMITPDGYTHGAKSGFFQDVSYPSIVSFGEDRDGELYTISFFDGTIGKITLPGDPLPVELEYFKAKAEECVVNLQWKSVMESRFSHFELQRSANARTFETIATIPASGANHIYSFTDANPFEKNTFYRLKMVDFTTATPEQDHKDQTFEYSRILSVNAPCDLDPFTVFPNPTTDGFKIGGLHPGNLVYVYNASGTLITTVQVNSEAVLELSLKGQAKGIYTINIEDPATGMVKKMKLVKE